VLIMATAWMLSSSTDRESVSWAVRSTEDGKDGRTLVCDVTFAGHYYDGVLDSGVVEPDFRLVLRGLALRAHDLERLVDRLEAWLALPPSEQARAPVALACSMGGLFDQSLLFELGTRDDMLAGQRPVATFRYIVGRMTGAMSFPTDPDCLRGFVEGVKSALGA